MAVRGYPPPTQMTVAFEITSEEHARLHNSANARAQRLYGPAWLSKLYWYGLMPVSIVVISLLVDQPLVPAISFLVFWGLNGSLSHFYQKLYSRKLAELGKVTEDVKWVVSIEENGLAMKSELREYHLRWSFFKAVEESEKYIFVRANPIYRLIIPKRAFDTPEALASFISVLN